MPTFENLKVLLALLPGFISQRIAYYFGTQYKTTDLDSIISGLAFAVVNFMIAIPIGKIFKIGILKENKSIDQKFVVVVFIVSIITGMSWAIIDRNDLLYKINLTSKASRSHVWTKIFREYEGVQENKDKNEKYMVFVRILLSNGKAYFGYPHYRSEQQATDNIIMLKPAYLLEKTGSCTKMECLGLMLFEREMKHIEFIKIPLGDNDPCQFLK
jgi:hypothetical protein